MFNEVDSSFRRRGPPGVKLGRDYVLLKIARFGLLHENWESGDFGTVALERMVPWLWHHPSVLPECMVDRGGVTAELQADLGKRQSHGVQLGRCLDLICC